MLMLDTRRDSMLDDDGFDDAMGLPSQDDTPKRNRKRQSQSACLFLWVLVGEPIGLGAFLAADGAVTVCGATCPRVQSCASVSTWALHNCTQ